MARVTVRTVPPYIGTMGDQGASSLEQGAAPRVSFASLGVSSGMIQALHSMDVSAATRACPPPCSFFFFFVSFFLRDVRRTRTRHGWHRRQTVLHIAFNPVPCVLRVALCSAP